MTSYQIVMVVFAAVGLLSSVIGVFIYVRVELAKLQVKVASLEQADERHEDNLANFIKENRETHVKLFDKFDELKDLILKKRS